MKQILIADDHPAVRNGVKYILSGEFPDMQFGEAMNAAEVMQKLSSQTWDVLILDIDLPGRSGLDVLKHLRSEKMEVPVLVFSFHHEEQIAIRALRSGAFGYLAKDSADTELVKAINQILAGKKYLSPSVSEQLISQLENPSNKEPHELLSDREYETLLLLASGKTVSQIAEELSLSVSTMNTYRARVLEKMEMKSNAELIRYAIQNKLI